MDGRAIRVLLVEDDGDDYLLTRDLLAEIPGGRYALEWVQSYAAGLAAVGLGAHDVYLIDYRLGERNGLELLREARRRGCRAPLLLLTGVGDPAVDREATRAGAADFLVKDQLNAPTLERSIRYAIAHKRAEEELREARGQLEQRVAERTAELTAANARLAEADRRKDEFLATLAHELRNPLAPIRNAVALLRRRPVNDPVVEQMAAMLERQVTHLAKLVDDLMDVSRITRGKINLQLAPTDLVGVVRRALEVARPLLDERKHRVEVALPGEPLWVRGDALRLEQIFTNLLQNAAKYTPPGGRVWVSAERASRERERPDEASRERERPEPPDEAVVRVRDDGIGIRPEVLPRIFDMFQQGDRVQGRLIEGLGIGLTLVRRLVELHGGSITAASEGMGRGSEFAVRLPLAPAGGAAPAAPARGERRPRRVLVVDDNKDAASSLAALLRYEGNEARVVNDGPAALEAAREFGPEVILLDIAMPGMDGYAVARRLRQTAGCAATPIVALTGFGSVEDHRRTAEAGFDFHLTKPVDPDALLDLLARV
jgi:signal transduction histidine kinase